MKNPLAQSLEGTRVLDLSRVLAGPWAGQTLADLGAEVIKIEHPDQHDETRYWGPPFWNQYSAYYLSCNRGKKALALDLKHADGRKTLHDLVKVSDVLIENFRSSSLKELGVLPSDLFAINPRLVICSISGFGRIGPMADVPGYDFVIQGLSGMMAMNGAKDGDPSKFGVAIADLLAGHNAVIAILAGLNYRQKMGKGLHADVALADCAVAAMVNVVQSFLVTGVQPQRQGNEHLQIVPYQAFKSSSDWLIVAVGNDRQWHSFCQAIERMDLAQNKMFATNQLRVKNRQKLIEDLSLMFLRETAESWLAKLQAVDVPCGKVLGFQELFASELAKEKSYRVTFMDSAGKPLDFVASPLVGTDMASRFPPEPGQDSDDVLLQVLGYDAASIARLRRLGAVK